MSRQTSLGGAGLLGSLSCAGSGLGSESLVVENRMVMARACNLEEQGMVGPRFYVPMAQEKTQDPEIWDWPRATFERSERGWKAKLE